MGTYRRKPEIVDARQFDGERQTGLNLILWVNSNQGRAMWFEAAHRFQLTVSGRVTTVHKNWWVVLKQDGTFDRMSPEDFNEEFEQV